MAYDAELAALAERIRDQVMGEEGLTEQRMFGGLAFMVHGNMSVAASGQGGLMVRVDPAETDALREEPGAAPMVMRGREMRGWLLVESAALQDRADLEQWVARGVGYARSLPPKPTR